MAHVTEARYFLFASAPQLRAWWQTGMKEMGLQPDSGGCLGAARARLLSMAGGSNASPRLVAHGSAGSTTSGSSTVSSSAGADDIQATVDWWTQTHAIGGVRSEPSFAPVEQELVDEAPADIVTDCIPYRIVGKEATDVEGSLGSIDCLVESSLVIDIGHFRFSTVSALDDWWDRRLPGLPVQADSGGCLDGTRGETGTSRGQDRLLCDRRRGTDPVSTGGKGWCTAR